MAKTKYTFAKKQRELEKKNKKLEKLEKKKLKLSNLEDDLISSKPSETNFKVGQKVISLEMGIGEIVLIEQLNGHDDEFYVVNFDNKRVKNYFPINENSYFRSISCEKNLVVVLNKLKDQLPMLNLKDKKDRLDYYKNVLYSNDINKISECLVELSYITKLFPAEKKVFNKLIETVSLEVSLIFKMNIDDSRKKITELLKRDISKKVG